MIKKIPDNNYINVLSSWDTSQKDLNKMDSQKLIFCVFLNGWRGISFGFLVVRKGLGYSPEM